MSCLPFNILAMSAVLLNTQGNIIQYIVHVLIKNILNNHGVASLLIFIAMSAVLMNTQLKG